MRLYTPESLRYPITVTKLLKQPGDEIEQDGHLFNYEYKSTVQQWDEFEREDVEVEKTFYSTFESELEGTVAALNVKPGQVITRRTMVADVDEACKHEVQFGGLCANCGKDMNEIHSYNESAAMTQRATINTIHGRTELLVSEEEATKADEEAKRRLLDTRRLSLVVDLDQTIIHASVEPTIGEWQNDPSNPNHEAVKDVCKFQLVDDLPGRPGTWYYIKLRPGLREFLKTMSQYYEMHIYTMGTRAYAENIAKIVDPEHHIFGDRILSRDESGSMTAKNLKRLFPVDTKMVVIIDDRADVWHWIPNLVRVNVYEFFVGIGDINSSFLPKRPELDAKPKPAKVEQTPTKSESSEASTSESTPEASTTSTAPTTPPSTTPAANGEVSAVAQMLNMAGQQDAKSIKTKEEEQEQAIAAQLEDRPLLQKQKMLDALEEEEAKTSPAAEAAAQLLSENGDKTEDAPKDEPPKKHYRHNLLQDDDTELTYLQQSLRNIHKAYYEEYERDAAGSKGSRVAELRPGHTKKRSVDEFQHIPDAAAIMDSLKSRVLAGVHIVFSGVVPLGVDIQNHDIAIWAKSFGATVSESITKRTTHVIASPERRTAKVRQAAKRGGKVAIVGQGWLLACFSQWTKVDENPYRIHSDAPTNGAAGLPDSFDQGNDFMLSSSDDEAAQTEEETEDAETPNGAGNGRLTLDTDFDTDTDNEELQKHAPTMARQDSSPTETENADDWDDINAELEEFLEDSDVESVSENESEGDSTPPLKTTPSQRKRKSDDRDSEDEADGSRLQKRKKEALGRTSSLTNLVASSQESGASAKDDEGGGEAQDEEADGDFDLEAALAAELDQDEEEEAAAENGGGTGALDGQT
ncbi:hypothetical protein M409DRAFT_62130 [Zasmidium cellare ATCC 36951]|uniref:RNA polymerase II subunit A C-terminal domain phosphatase n=1 Tax=Zasmidium cellare ATCC 36951 TaxID=1080233 RepID=A0A6A6D3C1_ZASCE|nr:uncharacterized protein M409DRAFT_62130 [Zasmidium cellare ATCC 36951]KAF2173911.1 hypothetical protein M409DRAFT_62130 [Zasmidium cellare ATCC 36951]